MDQPVESRPRPGRSGFPWTLVVIAVLAAGAFVIWRFFSLAPAPASPTVAPQAAAQPAAQAPPSPPAPMPSLADADKLVRDALAPLSSTTLFAHWLMNADLARRFVATVNAIADGKSPRQSVGFLAPVHRFTAVRRGDKVSVDPKSFERYDAIADVIGGVDMRLAAKAYAALHPLLSAAYAEIGAPNSTLDERLALALDQIAATPVPTSPVALEPGPVVYRYADPKLEALSATNKHLLRMGPRNMKIVQQQAHELRSALRAAGPGAGDVVKASAVTPKPEP